MKTVDDIIAEDGFSILDCDYKDVKRLMEAYGTEQKQQIIQIIEDRIAELERQLHSNQNYISISKAHHQYIINDYKKIVKELK